MWNMVDQQVAAGVRRRPMNVVKTLANGWYLYELLTGTYMLDWWEKVLFSKWPLERV
jgi:hypothetical protein